MSNNVLDALGVSDPHEPDLGSEVEAPPAKPPSGEKAEKDGRKGGDRSDGDELKALRRDLERTREELRAVTQSERHWAEMAMKAAPVAEKPKPAEDADDGPDDFGNDGTDAIDLLSTKGLKGLVEKGLMTQRAARKLVRELTAKQAEALNAQIEERIAAAMDAKIGALTKSASLVTEYPDLGNPKSELYQETQEQLRILVEEEPELKGRAVALKIAAKQAAAVLGARRKQDRDADRKTRINLQAPDLLGSRDDEDSEFSLDPAISRMLAELEVDQTAYVKRRQNHRGGAK